MLYRRFGRTDLRVSALGLRTHPFEFLNSRKDALALLSRAEERGLTYIDVAGADGLTAFGRRGGAEPIVGEWLAQRPGRRENLILSATAYGEMGYGPNADSIRRACDDALRRLRTDHIDLLVLHRLDRGTAWDEVLETTDGLERAGKISHIGSSHLAGWHIATFNQEASKYDLPGFVGEQCAYSLLRRSFELEVLPACQAFGMAVTVSSPLASGLLGGVLRRSTRRQDDPVAQQAMASLRPQLEAWEALCHDIGREPAAVALAWLLHNPWVTAPLIGPRTFEQLDVALQSFDVEWSSELADAIDRIFPGPVREAPDAFWPIPGVQLAPSIT